MRYRTIVADPPWDYDDGFVTMTGAGTRRQRAERQPVLKRATRPLPYPSLSVAEIRELDIPAAPSAHLFLWTTNRYLPHAFGVIDEWGFTYTQTLVWLKERTSPFVASVAPNHCEYLLVGRRGNLKWTGALPSNIIEYAPGTRAKSRIHSRKPDVFLDLVEQVSPGPYLELFARRQRLGWDTWGNEALEHVNLGSGDA